MSAVCATGVFAGCDWAGSERPTERLPASAYTEDFDAAWTFIRDTYAYFDHEVVDWERVRVVLRPRTPRSATTPDSSACSRNSWSTCAITTRT